MPNESTLGCAADEPAFVEKTFSLTGVPATLETQAAPGSPEPAGVQLQSDRPFNCLVVGVGGQGSLLASKLLGHLLMEQGYDVKVSEVHGMSQRGGSVVTYVRYGDRVNSPVIDKGEADYIVSFELLEAARWLSYLKPDGQIVTSTQQIDPMPVITGAAAYPQDLVAKMKATGAKVDALDCLALAEQAGSAKAVNIVLMGRLSHYFDLPEEAWQKSLEAMVPAKFLELNKKAFQLGKNA